MLSLCGRLSTQNFKWKYASLLILSWLNLLLIFLLRVCFPVLELRLQVLLLLTPVVIQMVSTDGEGRTEHHYSFKQTDKSNKIKMVVHWDSLCKEEHNINFMKYSRLGFVGIGGNSLISKPRSSTSWKTCLFVYFNEKY